jgi:hypothetical protein
MTQLVRAARRNLISWGEVAEDLDQITTWLVYRHAAFDVNPFDLPIAHANDECALGRCGDGRGWDEE